MATAAPMERLSHVDGVFNYLADPTQLPAYHVNPDRSKPPERPAQSQHSYPVYNGRNVQDQLSLDVLGLMLTKRETSVSNFYGPEEVKKVYYPEAAQLVKDMTGASKVVVFDQNVRCAAGPSRERRELARPFYSPTTTIRFNPAPSVSKTYSRPRRPKCSCSTAFV